MVQLLYYVRKSFGLLGKKRLKMMENQIKNVIFARKTGGNRVGLYLIFQTVDEVRRMHPPRGRVFIFFIRVLPFFSFVSMRAEWIILRKTTGLENGWSRFVVSHPFRDNTAEWMGHRHDRRNDGCVS